MMSVENSNKSRFDSQLIIYNSLSLNDLEIFNKKAATIHIIRRFSFTKNIRLENFNEINEKIFYSFSQKFNSQEIKKKKYNEEEKKEIKEYLLLKILKQRKKEAKKISNFLKRKLQIIKIKKGFLIQKIIQKRTILITKIQSHIKAFLVRKSINSIFNCENVFFYCLSKNLQKFNNYENNVINETIIKCKIYNKGTQSKEINFKYCKYLKCFFLPLSNLRVIKRLYRVNFIINNNAIIDPRYEIDTDNKGNFYNLIHKNMIYRFKKNNFIKDDFNSKFWESIFEIKKRNKRINSFDSVSLTNSNLSNEIMNENEKNKKTIKPILKKSGSRKLNYTRTKRKVSFNNKISFSY